MSAANAALHTQTVDLVAKWLSKVGDAASAKALRARRYEPGFAAALATDAIVLGAFRSLSPERRVRFEPIEQTATLPFAALVRAGFNRDATVCDAEQLLADLRAALAIDDKTLTQHQEQRLAEIAERERNRPAQVERERVEFARRLDAERETVALAERQREQRIADAVANRSRQRTCGVISNLTPWSTVPHDRERCPSPQCAEEHGPTDRVRARRSPEVAAWMREQIATLSADTVGFVAMVPNQVERAPSRPITARLLRSPASAWEEWSACSVVDAIIDGGVLVVLTDSDERGPGETAAIALAMSRGITVDVRRSPC